MVRIRGQIGQWPVDLTIEMDAQDWAQLASQVSVETVTDAAVPKPAAADDQVWQTTLELLRSSGSVEGPQLMSQLAALAGGEAAGKRLLVRLRHSPLVRMETGADAPVYHWVG
ncbi:hypothetical protein [Pseudomonas sp. TTU2014-080ASC]|jgi:hypothetical protein|uniref:hypothetical protein n=1 Tax=Pseudomonas sp. TTU2014-080ASC TaxID=1729724 RepID=UPI00071834FD|nr:hypothetical protein [Pseudomonas sp. TTU2014-080ASC]KRW57849.1 hypothetical protein AO726_19535 [Pseudomonas sp. TTU2014-080ASC]